MSPCQTFSFRWSWRAVQGLTLVCLLAITGEAFGQATERQFETPDKPATYPGGNEALYQYIYDHIIYPPMTLIQGRQGKVLIRFVVTATGYIDPESVTIVLGFDEECNREAARVIRECKTKWTPASKGTRFVDNSMVLPIQFSTDDGPLFRSHVLNDSVYAIPAVVAKKPGTPRVRSWQMYEDYKLVHRAGYLDPGDSIEVVGWGPHVVAVRRYFRIGYVSWKAVEETDGLRPLLAKIGRLSDELEKEYMHLDSIRDAKRQAMLSKLAKSNSPVRALTSPDVQLSLTSGKKSLAQGECTIVELALIVHGLSRYRLEFHELPQQVHEIEASLGTDNCWMSSRNGVSTVNTGYVPLANNTLGYSYKIFRRAYCPADTRPLTLPAVTLKILYQKDESNMELVAVKSNQLTVPVRPSQQTTTKTNSDFYTMNGSFVVTDSLHNATITTDVPVTYSVTVRGTGHTFGLTPPVVNLPDVQATFIESIFADTIDNNTYRSSKTFIYSMLFSREGVYDLSRYFQFTSNNFLTKEPRAISTARKFVVTSNPSKVSLPAEQSIVRNVIAIDASQSMQIEDYVPDRLGAVKQGISMFLDKNRAIACRAKLVVFGGDARPYALGVADTCYSRRQLNALDFNLVVPGTALGNAIWTAVSVMPKDNQPKQLVLISDGDNTAGNLTPEFAVRFAKKYGVKVHCIGVGNQGLVPFGRDYLGNPNMVDNTVSFDDLKKIAASTGGSYAWAKDAAALSGILASLMK